MPRIANTTDALLADLQKRLATLVHVARKEGRDDALADLQKLVTGGRRTTRQAASTTSTAKPKKRRRKSSKPRRNAWANYTPEQRLARINAMRKGRGLPPKKSL